MSSGALDLGTLFGTIELEDKFTPALMGINSATIVAAQTMGKLDAALETTSAYTKKSTLNLDVFIAGHAQLSVAQARVTSYSTVVRSLASELQKLQDAEAALNDEQKGHNAALEKTTVDLHNATNEYIVAKEAVNKLNQSLKDVENTIKAGTAKPVGALAADLSSSPSYSSATMISGMSAAGREAELAAQKVGDGWAKVGPIITEVGRGMRAAGVTMAAAMAPVAAAGFESIKFASDFDASMVKIQTLAGASKQEVDTLHESVLKLSDATAIGPEKLAQGLFVIESAGFRGADAMDILTKAAKMSAIGMGEVEVTTRAVVGAVLTFKESNLTATQAADQLVRTVQLGNMKVDELVGALARVNPVAAAFGVKFADINAAIATFTHLGAPVDVAVTGIRAVLSTILTDGPKTEKGLKALGISMQDLRQEILTKGLTEGLIHLVDTAKNMPGGLDKLHEVFGNIRAFTEVLATAGSQAGTYQTITDKVRGATDGLEDSFAIREQLFAFKWQQLQTRLQNLAIQLGDSLLPILSKLMDFFGSRVLPILQDAIEWWGKLPEPIRDVGLAIAGVLIIAGPALMFFGELTIAIGHLAKAYETISGISAITGLANGFRSFVGIGAPTVNLIGGMSSVGSGAAAAAAARAAAAATGSVAGVGVGAGAAVGGLSALAWTGIGLAIIGVGIALYELYRHWDEVVKISKEAYDWISNRLVAAFDDLNLVGTNTAQRIKEGFNFNLGANITEWIKDLGKSWDELGKKFLAGFNTDFNRESLAKMGEILSKDWDSFIEGGKAAVTETRDFLVPLGQDVARNLKVGWDSFADSAKLAITETRDFLVPLGQDVARNLKVGWDSFADSAKLAINETNNFFAPIGQEIARNLKFGWGSFTDSAKSAVSNAGDLFAPLGQQINRDLKFGFAPAVDDFKLWQTSFDSWQGDFTTKPVTTQLTNVKDLLETKINSPWQDDIGHINDVKIDTIISSVTSVKTKLEEKIDSPWKANIGTISEIKIEPLKTDINDLKTTLETKLNSPWKDNIKEISEIKITPLKDGITATKLALETKTNVSWYHDVLPEGLAEQFDRADYVLAKFQQTWHDLSRDIGGWIIIGVGEGIWQSLLLVVKGAVIDFNNLKESFHFWVTTPTGLWVGEAFKDWTDRLTLFLDVISQVQQKLQWVSDHIPKLPFQGEGPLVLPPVASGQLVNGGVASQPAQYSTLPSIGALPPIYNIPLQSPLAKPFNPADYVTPGLTNFGTPSGDKVKGTDISHVIDWTTKDEAVSKKAQAAADKYNKLWENAAAGAGSYRATLDSLNASQIKDLDYLIREGISVADLADMYPKLEKTQIEAVKATQKYRDTLGELSETDKAVLAADITRGIEVADSAKWWGISVDLAEKFNKELRAGNADVKRYNDAWADLNSVGVSYMDTLKTINPVLIKQVDGFLQQGASIKTLVDANLGLSELQIKAIKETAEYRGAMGSLTLEQEKAIETAVKQGKSLADVEKALNINKEAAKSYSEALKLIQEFSGKAAQANEFGVVGQVAANERARAIDLAKVTQANPENAVQFAAMLEAQRVINVYFDTTANHIKGIITDIQVTMGKESVFVQTELQRQADVFKAKYDGMLASGKFTLLELEAEWTKEANAQNIATGISTELTQAQLDKLVSFHQEAFAKMAASQAYSTNTMLAVWKKMVAEEIAADSGVVTSWLAISAPIIQSLDDIASHSTGAFQRIIQEVSLAGKAVEAFGKALQVTNAVNSVLAKAGPSAGANVSNDAGTQSEVPGAGAGVAGTVGAAAAVSTIQGVSAATVVGSWIAVGIAVYQFVSALRAANEEAKKLKQISDAMEHASIAFSAGTNFSDQLNHSLSDTEIDFAHITALNTKYVEGFLRVLAEAANLSDIIKELGGVSALTADQMERVQYRAEQLFTLIALGGPIGQKAIKTMDDTLIQFTTDLTKNGGLVSKFFLDMAAQAKAAGITLQQVADFQAAQSKAGEEGIVGALKITGDAYTKQTDLRTQLATATGQLSDNDAQDLKKVSDLQVKLSDAQKNHNAVNAAAYQEQIDNILKKDEGRLDSIADINKQLEIQQKIIDATGVHSQSAAGAISGALLGVISDQVAAGMSFGDAIKQAAPGIAALKTQLDHLGIGGGDAFDFLNQQVELFTGDVTGPALTSIEAYANGLVGLHNSGQLTQDTFSGLTEQIGKTAQVLVSQGVSGHALLTAMQSPLQKIWELETEFGYAADDSTQALINEAVATGEVGEKHKSVNDQMLDGINKLVDSIGYLATVFGYIPPAADAAATGINTAFNKVVVPDLTPTIGTPGAPSLPGVPGATTPIIDPAELAKQLAAQQDALKQQTDIQAIHDQVALQDAMKKQQALDDIINPPVDNAQADALKKQEDIQAIHDQAAIDDAANTQKAIDDVMGQQVDTSAITLPIDTISDGLKGLTGTADDVWYKITDSMSGTLSDASTTIGQDVSGNLFAALQGDAKDATSKISKALEDIKIPTVNIPVTITMPDGSVITAEATTGSAQHLAIGGMVQYRATGGPMGTDTVPTWLTPGEDVLSVSQTKTIDTNFSSLSMAASMMLQAAQLSLQKADGKSETKIPMATSGPAWNPTSDILTTLPMAHIDVTSVTSALGSIDSKAIDMGNAVANAAKTAIDGKTSGGGLKQITTGSNAAKIALQLVGSSALTLGSNVNTATDKMTGFSSATATEFGNLPVKSVQDFTDNLGGMSDGLGTVKTNTDKVGESVDIAANGATIFGANFGNALTGIKQGTSTATGGFSFLTGAVGTTTNTAGIMASGFASSLSSIVGNTSNTGGSFVTLAGIVGDQASIAQKSLSVISDPGIVSIDLALANNELSWSQWSDYIMGVIKGVNEAVSKITLPGLPIGTNPTPTQPLPTKPPSGPIIFQPAPLPNPPPIFGPGPPPTGGPGKPPIFGPGPGSGTGGGGIFTETNIPIEPADGAVSVNQPFAGRTSTQSTPVPMETNITFTIGPVDNADINDVNGILVPKLIVALREDAGGIRSAIEAVARKVN